MEGVKNQPEDFGRCMVSHRQHGIFELERDQMELCFGMVSQETGGSVASNIQN